MTDPAGIGGIWRRESARIVAGLARTLAGDVGLAEELAQDALVAALEQWPTGGVPDNPGAWLTTVARRRAVDALRRMQRRDRGHAALAHDLRTAAVDEPPPPPPDPDDVADDVLRLMLVSCHPVLSPEARVALTLKVVAGLRTDEIARAFLVTEATVAQRVVRAKRALAVSQARFEVPVGPERAGRLASVMEVLYLVFNEGYAATGGTDWIRTALCDEAIRLARMLARLAPDSAEAHGLLALLELQHSRRAARVDAAGIPVLLHEQDRDRWDRDRIRAGFTALLRARETRAPPGPYVLQAAIAACHARARSAADTDWAQIVALYDLLVRVVPSPVVALNRAVAVAMARGPEEGLQLIEPLLAEPAMARYPLLPGTRGHLLARLGRTAPARAEFERAASMTASLPEREVWLRRAAALRPEPAPRQPAGGGPGLGEAAAAFLARPGPSPGTVRSYRQTLDRLRRDLGDDLPLCALSPEAVARVFASAWSRAAPATWNRHRAALRAFAAWAGTSALDGSLDRLPAPRGRARPLDPRRVAALTTPATPLRERALWRVLHESGAPAREVLALDVDELDLAAGRARHGRIAWARATSALLAELVEGRSRGPVFLAERRPGPGRPRPPGDLCPDTGRGRLSYPRAEYLFKRASGGATLRALSGRAQPGARRAASPRSAARGR
ncbi:sigma-70 family RNA polymerase sigma factor [Pseudonocardia humida]|uniref:RNA polymerase sigma factor n=1 Tax=Pseudonocardia humida TaxID=2800819 RepID=A0ABT1ADR9_9PSEU|nr:sigma-70 family RNA polymerase sigma factor [Pseudonocardia humida]MCO1661168.1 sigma-70 family RNA polymerase sigma factor [Pseudonocardia humida]